MKKLAKVPVDFILKILFWIASAYFSWYEQEIIGFKEIGSHESK